LAKRDPITTARNKEAAALDVKLKNLLPDVERITECNQLSINAKIGSKHQTLMNVKERCIQTSDEFVSLYLDAMANSVRKSPLENRGSDTLCLLTKWYQEEPAFQQYLELFLERTFLRHYNAYARTKPADKDAILWIGENNADYGLLVTPRFNESLQDWENDKSEIRRLNADYFTVGHVLKSGLVVPGKDKQFNFANIEEYLKFFEDVLVRNAGSRHQDAVAQRYVRFVRESTAPLSVPLLIPELRYLGREKKHKYRLDFCVIDPYSLIKIGFELSPWSTHGQLRGTNKKTVTAVNDEARQNFEYEIKKCESYFEDYGIHVSVFTDDDLKNPDGVFRKIEKYLRPERRATQLRLHSRDRLMNLDVLAEVS